MERLSWDQYFMDLAIKVSTRSTCDRKHVGCVIIRDKRILSTGYNGSISGDVHCCDVGCDIENNHCIRTVHSEQNAITYAARFGVSLDQSSIYITAFPCWTCFKMCISSGINEFIYNEEYKIDDRVLNLATKNRIKIRKIH